MALILNKSTDELMAASMARLSETVITQTSPGGIARLLLAVINENIAGLYEVLSASHVQAFLSTGTDDALDELGLLMACSRITDESDADYRYRLSCQTLTAATANETAIRLAALSVSGVKNVSLVNRAYGPGSFALYVLTDDAQTSDTVLTAVKTAVSPIVAFGMKYEILTPQLVPVALAVNLVFLAGTGLSVKTAAIASVSTAVSDYLRSRNIGEALSSDALRTVIMGADTSIGSYILYDVEVGGVPMEGLTVACRSHERFIESSNEKAITIS